MIPDKDIKLIFKRINERQHKEELGELTQESFDIAFVGELIFLYVDTYGIPLDTMIQWIKEERFFKVIKDK